MNKLVVTLSVAELKAIIAETIGTEINNHKLSEPLKTTIEPHQFMTRREVSNLFQVSLVTIDKWRRFSLLPKTIKLSGRTYFLRNEIEKLVANKISMNHLKNF